LIKNKKKEGSIIEIPKDEKDEKEGKVSFAPVEDEATRAEVADLKAAINATPDMLNADREQSSDINASPRSNRLKVITWGGLGAAKKSALKAIRREQTREERAKGITHEVDLRVIGLYPSVSVWNYYDLLFALFIASVHSLAPGVFRIFNDGVAFGGNDAYDKIICSLHIVVAFPMIVLGCMILRNVAAMYSAQAKALLAIADITKPSHARKAGLQCYVDLLEGNNIDSWLLVRKDILSEYAADPDRSKSAHLLAPVLILHFSMLIALFFRVVVLQIKYDIFNILSMFDICVMDLYLLSIIINAIKCNWLSSNLHNVVLERERYRLSKQMFVSQNAALLKKISHLLDAAISRVNKLQDPVRVLGFVIDQNFVVSFLGLVAAGVSAGLSRILLDTV